MGSFERRSNLMTAPFTELVVSIGAGPEADDQQVAELSQHLREDLLGTDVESVEHLRGAQAPAGSKGDAVSLATLAVTLAPAALTGLITMLQSWLTRHERASITLQKGDQKVTVTGTLSKEQQQVIADWLHAGKVT
jgi:hypothetical protein